MAGPLARPMLNTPALLDPDAAAVIAELQSRGVTLTAPQTAAIDEFFSGGRTAGWLANLRRLYLPVWNNASPNALDWIARGSGTFVGGGTFAASYYQPNGTDAYLLDNAAADTHITSTDLFFGTLILTSPSGTFRSFMGLGTGSTNTIIQNSTPASTTFTAAGVGSAGLVEATVAQNVGIFSVAFDGATRRMKVRQASGNSTLGTNAIASSNPVPSWGFAIGARQTSAGTFQLFTDSRIGAAFISRDGGDTINDAFTLALRDLWENLTGLTIP